MHRENNGSAMITRLLGWGILKCHRELLRTPAESSYHFFSEVLRFDKSQEGECRVGIKSLDANNQNVLLEERYVIRVT